MRPIQPLAQPGHITTAAHLHKGTAHPLLAIVPLPHDIQVQSLHTSLPAYSRQLSLCNLESEVSEKNTILAIHGSEVKHDRAKVPGFIGFRV